MSRSRYTEHELRRLHGYLDRLLGIVDRMHEHGLRVRSDDHFGFVALSFLSKQAVHAASIVRLETLRDVELVARTMLDGFAQLSWIAQDRDVRALEYRGFAAVQDWLLLHAQLGRGEEVDDESRARVEENFREYGQPFKHQAGRARAQGKTSYGASWLPKSVEDIFSELGVEYLYHIYQGLSEWVHWDVRGIATSLAKTDRGVTFAATSVERAVMACHVAVVCLLQAAGAVAQHLTLPAKAELDGLYAEYAAVYEPRFREPPRGE